MSTSGGSCWFALLTLATSVLVGGCGRLGFSVFGVADDASLGSDTGVGLADAGDRPDGSSNGNGGFDGAVSDASAGGLDGSTSDGSSADSSVDPPDAAACELPLGLQVHLRFDEGTGLLAADASGNGHDGTLAGGTTWVAGRLDGAVSFDGVDGEVNVGSDAAIDDLTTLSMCAWIITRGFPETWPTIADKSVDSFTGGWNFYADEDGEFGFLTNRSQFAEGGRVVRGEWTHVCASWDGTAGFGGIALYLNGVATPHGRTGTNASGFQSDAARDLAIGRVAGGGLEFDGEIDDYQLYDRVLSLGEIQQILSCASR